LSPKTKPFWSSSRLNKAYRATSTTGFSDILKNHSDGKQQESFSEPFGPTALFPPYKTRQRMLVTSHDLTLEEINTTLD